MDHFKDVLLANNCHIDHLKEELLFDHINRYVSKSSAEKCWPIIFRIGDNLGIRNLIHILHICLVAPLSNVESERVFSLLWRIFSKERQSLKHDTRVSLKKRCHDAASGLLNVSSDEESEEQINPPQNVLLECISDDE